jgi:type IV pilus assembly protein PilQ
MPRPLLCVRLALLAVLCVALGRAVAPSPVEAQDRPPERQLRSYIPPEQLVSFQPDTPFNQFVELLNPVMTRETGKEVVDPEDRTFPIGVSISGMHYFDAFELVLRTNDLTYRETEQVYLVEDAPEPQNPGMVASGMQAQGADPEGEGPLATLGTREIRINAILFNMNLTKVRELGIDWSQFLSSASGGGGQGGGGQGGGGGGAAAGQGGQGGGTNPRFFVDTEDLFENVDDVIQAPDQVELGVLARFFRALEQEDLGQTVANPEVTVQSGEQGQIQIGQDVPVQTRDFSGNTVTQFFQTGIIVDVTPTLLSQPVADSSGAPVLDFIHMDVRVEDSNSQPTASGPLINRNQATTKVLLLDGEATAIGGLTTTQETESRRGIPLLKDLPPWFFGLRYVFGREVKNVTERELLIVLQAEIVDPLRARADRQERGEDLVNKRRIRVEEAIQRLGDDVLDAARVPEPEEPETDNNAEEEGPPETDAEEQ